MGATKRYMMEHEWDGICIHALDIDEISIGSLEDGIRPGDYCQEPTDGCTYCEAHCDDPNCKFHAVAEELEEVE